MPFRARKRIPIIPGFVYLNLSGSTGKNTGTRGGASWTFRLGKLASYSTRDGKYRINTPGLGWWESSSRSQRRKRDLEKRVAKVQRTGGAKATGRGGKDPQAAMYGKWFADLRREGVAPAQAAHDAGRCEHCGNRKRSGQWCVPCAEQATKEREKAEARATARERQESRLYGPPSDDKPPRPASPRPAQAPAPSVPGSWTSNEEFAARIAQMNEDGDRHRQDRTEAARAAGACGHPTQKDRSPCQNPAGSCPHHAGARL